MRAIIKFNKNTDVKEIENVIEAAVKKYVVKNDRYSTTANSAFEIEKNGNEYKVVGKRINSHYIDLQLCYDELADDDIYELTIDTYNIFEFEGYVERTEFSDLVTVEEDKALVVDDKEFTETKQSIKYAERLYLEDDAASWETAHTIIDKEQNKLNELKEANKKMIINTEHVEEMLKTMTAREISKKTGVSERTIQKYKSGELSWLGKNSLALAEVAEQTAQMQYYVNVNDNRVIEATEYIDVIIREAVEVWEELDEEEKQDYDFKFTKFYEEYSEIDKDFVMSDKKGNVLDDENQAWNDYTISYQAEKLAKYAN
ncbi:hypothetical protein IGI96_000887 [Enterococcus sp. DIV0421]|uniref:hypothetical protein n=1 Tax=Enterococcus sp. DIV0421 TaxID=2774688 RepID=UPI003F21D8E1